MNVCAKFQLPSSSRSSWKVCGGVGWWSRPSLGFSFSQAEQFFLLYMDSEGYWKSRHFLKIENLENWYWNIHFNPPSRPKFLCFQVMPPLMMFSPPQHTSPLLTTYWDWDPLLQDPSHLVSSLNLIISFIHRKIGYTSIAKTESNTHILFHGTQEIISWRAKCLLTEKKKLCWQA